MAMSPHIALYGSLRRARVSQRLRWLWSFRRGLNGAPQQFHGPYHARFTNGATIACARLYNVVCFGVCRAAQLATRASGDIVWNNVPKRSEMLILLFRVRLPIRSERAYVFQRVGS